MFIRWLRNLDHYPLSSDDLYSVYSVYSVYSLYSEVTWHSRGVSKLSTGILTIVFPPSLAYDLTWTIDYRSTLRFTMFGFILNYFQDSDLTLTIP